METTYFDKTGKENTEETLKLAKKAAEEEGIDTLVLASTTGYTAEKAIGICQGLKLIVVGIGRDDFPKELIEKLEKQGAKVYFSDEEDYDYPQDMQTAFRRFSQGTKVSIENAVIATKENALEPGKKVVSLAGTHWGADTALVVRAAKEFNDIVVEELICKPRQPE